MAQFALLDGMLQEWRSGGHGHDTLELWVVGYPTTQEALENFAGGSEAACFMDGAGVFTAWGATNEDIFVLDAGGCIAYETSATTCRLSTEACRSALDEAVRGLL